MRVTDADLIQAVHDLATMVYAGREDDCVRLTPEQAERLSALAKAGLAKR